MAKSACISAVLLLALLMFSEAAVVHVEGAGADGSSLTTVLSTGNRRLLGSKSFSITISKGAVKKAEVKEEKKVVKEVVVVKSHCAYFHKFGCHPWFSKHG